jgi:hypothetical protein
MGISQKTLVLGDYEYRVTALGAITGRQTLVRLGNIIGPGFRMATSFEKGLVNLLADLKPSDLDWLCDLMGKETRVTGGEFKDANGNELTPLLVTKVFNEHFSSNYAAMFDWLAFCIVEVNFPSFFDQMQAVLEKYTPKAPAPAQSAGAKA